MWKSPVPEPGLARSPPWPSRAYYDRGGLANLPGERRTEMLMIVDPRLAEQPQPPRRVPEYAENGSARRPGMIALALVLPGVFLLGVLAAALAGSAG